MSRVCHLHVMRSVSSLMTTTEAIIVEALKDEKEAGAGARGGMGGMGGMDYDY